MEFRYDKYDFSRTTRVKLGIFMGIMLLFLIGIPALYLISTLSLSEYINVWAAPEFLINYEGGFVRRGLIGEGLYLFGRATGISPIPIIYIFSFSCFITVVYLMLRGFQKKGWAWWIIFAPALCGYIGSIVRKDYMMFLMIMALIWLASKITSTTSEDRWKSVKILLMYLILAFAMLNHEGVLFFGVGATCLYLWNVAKRPQIAMGLGALGCILFILMALNRGDAATVAAIYDSLDSLGTLPERPDKGPVDALQWKLGETFQTHFLTTFSLPYSVDVSASPLKLTFGIILWLIRMILTYYLMTNLPAIFTIGKTEEQRIATRDNVGGLLILTWVTMLPMFLLLCCDRSRVTQFWMMGAYLPAMLLPASQTARILPARVMRVTGRLNDFLVRILAPRPWILILLFLVMSAHPVITVYRKLAGYI